MATQQLDVRHQWHAFLVDAWLKNKGAVMWMICTQFEILTNINVVQELHFNEKYPCSLKKDVFGFIAIYYPRISHFLLETKKNDQGRIAKIVSLLDKEVVSDAKRAEKYLAKARSEFYISNGKAKAARRSRTLVAEQRANSSAWNWNKCK